MADGSRFDLAGSAQASVLHRISENFLPLDASMEGRGVHAQAFLKGETFPAAYVEFDLLETRPGCRCNDKDFIAACDAVNDTLGSLADALIQSSVEDIGAVLARGPILHLSRLEVRSHHAGRGLGTAFGGQMVSRLVQIHRASLLVIKPFPLQFESCAPPAGSASSEAFSSAFNEAEAKLTEFYRLNFGAQRAGEGNAYLLAPLGGLKLLVDEFGWSLSTKN